MQHTPPLPIVMHSLLANNANNMHNATCMDARGDVHPPKKKLKFGNHVVYILCYYDHRFYLKEILHLAVCNLYNHLTVYNQDF